MTTSKAALEAAMGVEAAEFSLVKWVRPNDTKATKSHQAGYHLPVATWPMFYDRAGRKGENLERTVRIDWFGYRVTKSKWKWYGKKSRREYRLTTFGRGFPFREPSNVGSLLVIHSTEDPNEHRAFSLDTDEEIEAFLELTGLTAGDIGQYVPAQPEADDCLDVQTNKVLAEHPDFPPTQVMAQLARAIAKLCLGVTTADPDTALKRFTDVEFRLFRTFESREFDEVVREKPIDTIDRLISQGNSFNNRRKSRAGKSLEHHVGACLAAVGLPYAAQVKTEAKRTMDFIFPSQEAYDDASYPDDQLVALATKTSTKERWAQVLNEAGRCERKFLLTTQPATIDTIEDMETLGLTLVVPKAYLDDFPKAARQKIMIVADFIEYVRGTLGAPSA